MAQVVYRVLMVGVRGEIVGLMWVKNEVVELFVGLILLSPALGEKVGLARAAVAVDVAGALCGIPVADVLPFFCPNGALWVVIAVVVDFCENFIVDFICFFADKWQYGFALQPVWVVYADHIAQGGEEVNLRDHAIDDFAA